MRLIRLSFPCCRIQDKPTKYHICDALDALSLFMKTQRKKQLAERNRAEKRKKAAAGKMMKHDEKWPGATAGEASGSGSSVQPQLGPNMLAVFDMDGDGDGGEDDDDEDLPPLMVDTPILEPMADMPPLEPIDDMSPGDMPTFEPVAVMPGLDALD